MICTKAIINPTKTPIDNVKIIACHVFKPSSNPIALVKYGILIFIADPSLKILIESSSLINTTLTIYIIINKIYLISFI